MALQFDIFPNPLVVSEALHHAADEIERDMSPVVDSLLPIMASVGRTFELQGPGWSPWSLDYLLSRTSAHGPLPGQAGILMRTGATEASTGEPTNYTVETDSIAWNGEGAPEYSFYHLTGTSKMPQRSFTKVDDEARSEVRDIWAEWLGAKVEAVQYASGPRSVFRGAGGRFVSA